MKRIFVQLGVAGLSVLSFSLCFAGSKDTVYSLEHAQYFNYRTKGSFYIQAASFSNKSNASRYQHLLQSQTRYSVTISHKKNFYVVLIGPMNSAFELRKTAEALLHVTGRKVSVSKNTTNKAINSTFIGKIQHNPASAPSSGVAVSVGIKSPTPPVMHANAKWFVAVAGGAEFPMAKGNIYVNNGSSFPPPYDTDIYSTNQSASVLTNLSAGRRWEREGKWLPAYSLGLVYQHSFLGNTSGTVTQYSLPEFTNYNYTWKLSSEILLVSAKVNLYVQKQFSPYVTVGLGRAFNHSKYSETALPEVTPRSAPGFSGTSIKFAYNAGAGLDFQASSHLIINVGYLYQNLGDISGPGIGTWSGTSLGLKSYGQNEALVGITFLCD